ncbi:hypothetical protein R1sor_021907 [Riccia sorocarpa]|uniref:VWFA domain-containing protein n=1 Tax=Riccia sorocarpa TaxID=122646 RepID=A0ABD3GJU5_9MARC
MGLGAILLGLIAGPLDSNAQLQAPAQSPQVEGNRGDAYLKMMEDAVIKLASSVSETYNSVSCSDYEACVCTQDECRPLEGQLQCANISHNGRCNEYLQDIGCPSLRVSMLKSSVAYPRNDPTSIYTLDPAQARTICGTTKLDPVFRELFHQSQYHAEYYIGFPDGTRRSFPGREQEDQADKTCASYDARRRPWYSAAISNNTHLVILLDTRKEPLGPEYTEQSNTLDVFKDYATQLLDTVYYGDLVNAVTFSSKAQALEPKSIEVLFNESDPQRHVELDSLRTKLTNALPETGDSQSNLTAGLQEALRLFDPAANMKNIVLFTSGDISYDDLNLNATLKQLSDNLIRLFVFSLNSKGDTLDRVAAAATGFHIILNPPVSQNPLYRMRAYFSYVAVLHDKLRTTNPPFWTPSYQDYYDIGKIITVIYPAFTQNEPRKFLGVAAIDILYNEIEDILSDFQGALKDREESTSGVRVIGPDLFNSIQLPDFNESCGESFTEKALCEGNIPRTGQNFLDRTCCRRCGGNPDSQRWKTIVIVVGAVFGGLVFVAIGLALLKHFCWDPNRITVDTAATESDISSSGPYAPRGSKIAETPLMKMHKSTIPSEVRQTIQQLAAGTVEFSSNGR